MSEHATAARNALNRLYQRIPLQLASDAATLRIGLKAIDQLEQATPTTPAPVTLSIAQVKQAIDDGKMTLQEALEAEQASEAPRKTLVAWLEEELEEEGE